MARLSSFSVLLLATGLALTACAEEDDPAASSPELPPAEPSGQQPSVPPPPAPAADESVVVGHDRELRGAWISTVYNGTWPSKTGLDAATAKAELVAIFDALASARMNAVFFQVRSESDAVYPSVIEPWSRFLTGTQGKDPGFDPLAFAIAEGHRRGLEVHAWMNPYRGLVSTQITVDPKHVTKMLPVATRSYGAQLWMDPGAPEVRAHILDVVRDVLTRYDVDGLHFDDYFYPYPVQGQTFDDASTYAAYTASGGMLGKDDWRRSNVDALVHETSDLAAKTRSTARFGVSPFGIYRPGSPAGITGLDAYATIYCDPVRWMTEGWVDYLAPQLYWPTTQTAQAFGKLITWWADLSAGTPRSIFVGHDATRAGEAVFPVDEYDAEMNLVRAERPRGARGSIFFSAKPLVSDQASLRTMLATKHWTLPAATPRLATATLEPAGPAPEISVGPGAVNVATPPSGLRSIAVYREPTSQTFVIERIIPVAESPASSTPITLDVGRWVISTIDRRGIESRGRRIAVD